MKITAIVCNVVVFAITGMIILTEGMPRAAHYQILTLLMLLVPLLSAIVLVRKRKAPQAPRTDDEGSSTITLTNRLTVLCNLALLGAACWAVVAQYPYPEGNGMIPFAALTVSTPVLSLIALVRGERSAMREKGRSAARG